MRQCTEIKSNGKRCQAPALKGDTKCFWHSTDPEIVAKRKAARQKAGKHRRRGHDPSFAEQMASRDFRTLDDMEAVIELALRRSLTRQMAIQRARCIGYLARSWARIHETGDLEKRLEALERMMI